MNLLRGRDGILGAKTERLMINGMVMFLPSDQEQRGLVRPRSCPSAGPRSPVCGMELGLTGAAQP